MSSSASRPGWYALGFLALGALLADQFSKYAIEKLTPAGTTHVIIPGLLNLVHTNNPGVAFGLFADSGKPWLAPILIAFSVGGDRAACLAARQRPRGWQAGAVRTRSDFGRSGG